MPGFYVATNRQKNAFLERAQRLRDEAEAATIAAEPVLEVSPLADAQPQAAVPFERNSESEEYVQAPDIATVPERGRGRPKSEATEERQRRILELLDAAGADGMSKPELAAQLGEKEANVYTTLSKLADAGQVESRRDPKTRKYAWYAV